MSSAIYKKAARGPGHPRTHDREALAAAFARYIKESEIPILAEFSYQHDLDPSYLYKAEELAELAKWGVAKKESALERGMLSGEIPAAAAIFSLKQLGWRARQDVTHRGDAAHPIRISSADAKL